jgi:hypothetical protein
LQVTEPSRNRTIPGMGRQRCCVGASVLASVEGRRLGRIGAGICVDKPARSTTYVARVERSRRRWGEVHLAGIVGAAYIAGDVPHKTRQRMSVRSTRSPSIAVSFLPASRERAT